jgi:hypothetical protein
MKKKGKIHPKGKKKGKTPPLDPKADFDTPLRKAKKTPAQRTLISLPPAEPKTLVQDERMAASYVKPHFDRNKKGDRFVSLEVSMHLTKDHDGMMPKQIEQGWDFLGKEGYKRLDVIGVKPHAVKFFLTSKDADAALEIPAAKVTHVSLQVIEEKGTGKANKIIRLSFRLKVQLSRDVAHFSEWNFGDNYWIELAEAQGNLLEEPEEEEEEVGEGEGDDPVIEEEEETAAGEEDEAAAPGA